jgi:hypothetical protein
MNKMIKFFKYRNRVFYLHYMVIVREYYVEKEDMWFYECDKYSLYGNGKTKHSAWEMLNEEFAFVYDTYVKSDMSTLSKDAIKFRNKLKFDIKKIKTVKCNIKRKMK